MIIKYTGGIKFHRYNPDTKKIGKLLNDWDYFITDLPIEIIKYQDIEYTKDIQEE